MALQIRSVAADGATPARILTTLDRTEHVVRVVARGFWTPQAMDDHFDELDVVAAEARRLWGTLRLLSDVTGSPVQTAETLARVEQRIRTIVRAHDRVASVIDSSMVKIQMRRVVNGAEFAPFLSIDDALAWLNAER